MPKRILIHMGHVAPREPGFVSGTGTPGEIEVVSKIGRKLYDLLRSDGRLEPTLCGGDVPDGWTGDVVLALHCDGAGDPKASGYSFGWPTDEFGPKTAALIDALNFEYQQLPGRPRHRSDNYTGAMRGYYAWSRTRAQTKVLIEHGFLTNPAERAWIEKSISAIAKAWYWALLNYFGLPLKQSAAALRKRQGFYAWTAWYLGEGDWKPYGRRNPDVRPDVSRRVPWWPGFRAFMARRRTGQ